MNKFREKFKKVDSAMILKCCFGHNRNLLQKYKIVTLNQNEPL